MRPRVIATLCKKAAEYQPACIIIDEAEYLMARDSGNHGEGLAIIRACLMTAMSKVMKAAERQVIFLAVTDAPDHLDDGFIKKFPLCVYVRLPDRGACMTIMKE